LNCPLSTVRACRHAIATRSLAHTLSCSLSHALSCSLVLSLALRLSLSLPLSLSLSLSLCGFVSHSLSLSLSLFVSLAFSLALSRSLSLSLSLSLSFISNCMQCHYPTLSVCDVVSLHALAVQRDTILKIESGEQHWTRTEEVDFWHGLSTRPNNNVTSSDIGNSGESLVSKSMKEVDELHTALEIKEANRNVVHIVWIGDGFDDPNNK
jgi:hypothetical protein